MTFIDGQNSSEVAPLTETEVRTRFITPALQHAGWALTELSEEVTYFTDGRIIVKGNEVARGPRKRIDYLLKHKGEQIPLAVVEAKDNRHKPEDGMQQAIEYAEHLDVPFVFTSNGEKFVMHDRTGLCEDMELPIELDQFPSPSALYDLYKLWKKIPDNSPQEELILTEYYTGANSSTPRYYQRNAINRAIEAIAKEQKRILLVMATGTGKTFTAAQIIYRYWKSNFGKQKRILFLADRNNLVDQTKNGDFKIFGSAMTKISNRKIDKSYEIYLSLYQAVTGTDDVNNVYKEFSPDFFDLIVIDECHRGSARDDSSWRDILEYFSSAIQVGLTATPKETKDVSNIEYFGAPIYTYSLKQGIEDGFLAPYKVIRVALSADVFGYRPDSGALDEAGNEIEDKEYSSKDFDRSIVLPSRTQVVARRISEYLTKIDPFAKTIVFCVDQEHAGRMRQALVNENKARVLENSRYVVRITSNEQSSAGDLDAFTDPESKYPVIAVTSELMTTGVDSKTCKLIVLDKNINSMTQFKQIIGRGTRVSEEFDKTHFTILDFRGATALFADPEFDGEPVQILEVKNDSELEDALEAINDPNVSTLSEADLFDQDGNPFDIQFPDRKEVKKKHVINGVTVEIIGEQVQTLDSNGKIITTSLTDFTRKNIVGDYATLDDFLNTWNSTERRSAIIEEFEQKGIPLSELRQQLGDDIDDFDLILHVAYDQKPLKRKDRADAAKRSTYLNKYKGKAREVLEALIDKYADGGIESLEDINVLRIKPISSFGEPLEIISLFGNIDNYNEAVAGLEDQIYERVAA